MVNVKELVELLESVGIKGYEAKAYVTLITVGEATVATVASAAGIPQPRAYEVLESLVRKGLVEVRAGRPRTYRALPPEIGLSYYVKKYVDSIYSSTEKLTKELSRVYSTASTRRSPSIWISYSAEAGIEKVKALITGSEYDSILSINSSNLSRIEPAITKALRSGEGRVVAITVIGREFDEGLIRRLSELRGVELRRLPTGVVQMVETDLRDVIILSDNYSIHSREWELIQVINEVYYFGYWRIAEPLKEAELKRGVRVATTHHWIAMDLISRALNSGLNVKVRVRGYEVRSRKLTVVEGVVKEVIRVPEDTIRTIVLETASGTVKVGGLGATVEDIEARLIELRVG